MKILIMGLYGRSGMLHYTSQLANALAKKNQVYVLLPDYSETSLFDRKVRLIRIKAPVSIPRTVLLTLNPFNFTSVVKKINAIKPDIIHFADNHPWYLAYLPFIKKYTLVVTQHDVISHPGEMIRGKITNHVNNVLNQVSKIIVVHGKMLKELLVKKGYPESKITVMYMGAYPFFLKWTEKGIKTDKNNILFFGRILKYKGLDTLLRAMPIIKKRVPKIQLTIAGDGDLEPYSEYITHDIKPNLEIINKYFDEKEIPVLFQKTSIVLMPYTEASQSGIVLISYAFKKPLICTSVGSIPEVVDDGKTGVLIPPNNPEVLAKKIIELIKNDKKRLMLGENGYQKMKNFLNWEVQAQILTQAYQKAVSR